MISDYKESHTGKKTDLPYPDWFYLCSVIIYVVALFFLNQVYLKYDLAPPMGDEKYHFFQAMNRQFFLERGDYLSFLFYGDSPYPPLIYWVACLFFSFMGVSLNTGIISQGVFWVMLVFFLFYTGRELWDARVGSLAVIFTFSTPLFYHLSHEFLIDIPTSAIAIAIIYFVIKSDFYENRKYTLLASLFFGIGMLTKWQIVVYTLGGIFFAWGYALWRIQRKEQNFKKTLINCLTGILIAGAVSSVYYIPSLPYLPQHLHFMATGIVTGRDYFALLSGYVMNMPFFVIFLTGMSVYIFKELKNKEKNTKRNILFFNIIIMFVFQNLIWMVDPRYCIPMIPFFSFFAVFWFLEFKGGLRSLRYIFVFIFMVLSFLQTFGWLFSSRESLTIYTPSIISNPPYLKDWRYGEIAGDLIRMGGVGGTCYIMAESGDPPPKDIMSIYLFESGYYRGWKNLPDFQNGEEHPDLVHIQDFRMYIYKDKGSEIKNYYITFVSQENPQDQKNLDFMMSILREKKRGELQPLRRYTLPEGFSAVIYRIDDEENFLK